MLLDNWKNNWREEVSNYKCEFPRDSWAVSHTTQCQLGQGKQKLAGTPGPPPATGLLKHQRSRGRGGGNGDNGSVTAHPGQMSAPGEIMFTKTTFKLEQVAATEYKLDVFLC